jgi:hypothetical protein
MEDDMEPAPKRPFPASEPERASIRALKNWLLSTPGESAFEDQISRLRIADAIARFSSAFDKPETECDTKAGKR